MPWKELNERIPGVFPDHFTDNHGWPTPDDTDFWKYVENFEVLSLLKNQVLKFTDQSADFRQTFARAYQYMMGYGRKYSDQTSVEQVQSEVNDASLDLLFNAPFISVFLEDLGIPVRRHKEKLEKLFATKTIRKKISKLSDYQKFLGWWSIWYQAKDKKQIVDLMTESGLKPPEII